MLRPAKKGLRGLDSRRSKALAGDSGFAEASAIDQVR
jgi:hypothetical protein